MALRDNGFNIADGLKWLLYAMVAIIVALSGFSSQQVLKTIDKTETEKEKLKKEQDDINKAIATKLDDIKTQLSEQRSDSRIIQNTIAKQGQEIEELKKEVMELKIDKARRDGR